MSAPGYIDSSSQPPRPIRFEPGSFTTPIAEATVVPYTPGAPANWSPDPSTVAQGLDELAGSSSLAALIAANHVQASTANAVAASPVLSPTINFQCVGPARVVRVEAFAFPINTSGTLDDTTTMTLLLDGSPVAGVPTPQGSCYNTSPLTNPMATTLALAWNVTFPDNGPHTLGVQVATGFGTHISLGPGTIDAQEKSG
jgi:hypothetical protein